MMQYVVCHTFADFHSARLETQRNNASSCWKPARISFGVARVLSTSEQAPVLFLDNGCISSNCLQTYLQSPSSVLFSRQQILPPFSWTTGAMQHYGANACVHRQLHRLNCLPQISTMTLCCHGEYSQPPQRLLAGIPLTPAPDSSSSTNPFFSLHSTCTESFQNLALSTGCLQKELDHLNFGQLTAVYQSIRAFNFQEVHEARCLLQLMCA